MSTTEHVPAIAIKEFDEEMATTRRMLERLPNDQEHFKPHAKSMEFGYLSQLVAAIPGWITQTLRQDAIDLASGPKHQQRSAVEIVQFFDTQVKNVREALQNITGKKLDENWSLRMGEQTVMTLPRGEAARQHLRHLVHHRGQLSVY